MSNRIYRCLLSWCKNYRNRSVALFIVVGFTVVGIFTFITETKENHTPTKGKMERKSYGQGSKEEVFRVRIEKEEEYIPITIGERQYTSEEIQKIFEQSEKQMEEWILGENKSLNRVDSNLILIQEIPGQPIDVEWELDRYDIMTVNGELQEEKLEKDAIIVQLTAVLTYRERPEEQAFFQCAAAVYKKEITGKQGLAEEIMKLVKEQDEKTKTKDVVTLPKSVSGKNLTYYKVVESQWAVFIVMGVLIGGLLLLLEKQNEKRKEQEAKRQMMLDYPEVISKLTLLLGAGMTVKHTWQKMVADDTKQKELRGNRFIYEEMRITWHEMQSGITEAESYERFGRRTNMTVYIKLGALLSQNLRKGTKGLNELLKIEAVQAFEERKANAKRLGEEAGTKLLLPMFLMLGIVLMIVVIPAFLSIQM